LISNATIVTIRYIMYNKLFTKILDSSIWLEPTDTRVVWMTFIAAMDEDGFVQFASVSNVAHRARVSEESAQVAVKTLESPDPNSSDPDHEGRRIERVPGGWMVINSKKYRDLATREHIKQQTRDRVRKHREKKFGNAPVTHGNENETISDTDTDPYSPMAVTLVEYLNKMAERSHRPVRATLRPIIARLKEGATESDCKNVIDSKVAQWKGNEKMDKFLRPSTLFKAAKFYEYLGEKSTGPKPYGC